MSTQTAFPVPTRDQVSPANQAIFDKLEQNVGMVPNLYAAFAHSETALGDYLTLQSRKSTLKLKEKEIVNLVVSQVNECRYCLAAHTVLGQRAGFTADQVLEIRKGSANFDSKLNALANFARSVAENRGKVSDGDREAINAAGYTAGHVVDIIITIGDKIIANYLHNVAEFPVDFPAAQAL